MDKYSTINKAYETLDLNSTDSLAEVNRKYHRLALQTHPDKTKTTDSSKFREINEAYEKITDYLKYPENYCPLCKDYVETDSQFNCLKCMVCDQKIHSIHLFEWTKNNNALKKGTKSLADDLLKCPSCKNLSISLCHENIDINTRLKNEIRQTPFGSGRGFKNKKSKKLRRKGRKTKKRKNEKISNKPTSKPYP